MILNQIPGGKANAQSIQILHKGLSCAQFDEPTEGYFGHNQQIGHLFYRELPVEIIPDVFVYLLHLCSKQKVGFPDARGSEHLLAGSQR